MDTEKEIENIIARNVRVEGDKAWETSVFRLLLVSVITYGTAYLFLLYIKTPHALLASCIPVVGFLFSTQTFPPIKRWWLRTFWKGK